MDFGNNILAKSTTDVSYKGKQHFDKEHHRRFIQRETTFCQRAQQQFRAKEKGILTRSTTEVSYKRNTTF